MPLIVKTPLRVSLFGGGTDYREYFEDHGGVVLGGAINRFIYLVRLPMSSVAETRYRLTYSRVEAVDQIEDIQHPVIKAILQDEECDAPFNLAVISDIPGGSGLGSSSAFTVGFLNMQRTLQGIPTTKYDLARDAVRVESELLNERVGVQDQFHAAFGGFSLYEFSKGQAAISPINLSTESRQKLNESLVLVHTGQYRSASAILEEQVQRTKSHALDASLEKIKDTAYRARDVFQNCDSSTQLTKIGQMLSDSWMVKRSLSSAISNQYLDEIYEIGMNLGAYGGKLSGAGGGGFFTFLAPENTIAKMKDVFGHDRVIKVEFQDEGSRVMQSI